MNGVNYLPGCYVCTTNDVCTSDSAPQCVINNNTGGCGACTSNDACAWVVMGVFVIQDHVFNV